MPMKSMRWTLLFLGIFAILTGCTSKRQIVQEVPQYGPLYCYATLAEPDCYAAPLEKGSRRLVGAYEGPGGTQQVQIEVACLRLPFVEDVCPER